MTFMDRRRIFGTLGFCLTFVLGVGFGRYAFAQQPAGVSSRLVAVVDLGPEFPDIPALQGMEMWAHENTFPPGYVLKMHNHDGRPAIWVVKRGKIREKLANRPQDKEYGVGDVFVDSKATGPHELTNIGTTPYTHIEVAVHKKGTP